MQNDCVARSHHVIVLSFLTDADPVFNADCYDMHENPLVHHFIVKNFIICLKYLLIIIYQNITNNNLSQDSLKSRKKSVTSNKTGFP